MSLPRPRRRTRRRRRRRCRRSTRRAPGGVVRVARRPERRVLRARPHRELVEVGLADDHGAGGGEPLDDGGVVRRSPALEDLRRARRRDPARAHVVLQRDRHAGQRPGLAPGGNRRVDAAGRGPRLFGVHRLKAWISPSRASMAARCSSSTSTARLPARTAAAIPWRCPRPSLCESDDGGRGSARPRRPARRRAPRRGRGRPLDVARSTLISGYGWVIGSTSERSSSSMSAKCSSMPQLRRLPVELLAGQLEAGEPGHLDDVGR